MRVLFAVCLLSLALVGCEKKSTPPAAKEGATAEAKKPAAEPAKAAPATTQGEPAKGAADHAKVTATKPAPGIQEAKAGGCGGHDEGAAACGDDKKAGGCDGHCGEHGTAGANAPASAAMGVPGAKTHHGGAFTLDKTIALAEVLKASGDYEGKTVKIKAAISKVCKSKGCWMVIKDETANDGKWVRVTMKDYGFFVPKDCDGKTAIVEGLFQTTEISEAHAKHLAEDGGDDPSAVKGPKKEFKLVATAIDIINPAAAPVATP